MRALLESMLAMGAGWLVMMMEVGGWAIINHGGAGGLEIFGVWSAVVVGAAWLVVYLPVYAVMAKARKWMDWRVWVPIGLGVGGMVPFVIMMIPEAIAGGTPGLGLFLILPSTVGAVAAAVGCVCLNVRLTEG